MNYQLMLKRLIIVATCFSLLVIALGAYTRLVHAGLGCPDWPLCYGHAWAPSSTNEISQANLKFPDIPVNLTKTWPEMTHRYLASSLGLLCIFIVALGMAVKRRGQQFPIKHSAFLLGFIILQGLFGMWTVTLKLWPQVVTAHLLGGFTTFCLLLLLYLRSYGRSVLSIGVKQSLKISALIALVFVLLQVALGGWITSNYAALACTQLPWCSVSQISSNDIYTGFNFLQEIGPNYLGGQLDGGARIAIHLAHRLGALAVMISIAVLITLLIKFRIYSVAAFIGVVTIAQIGLGIFNVYFHLPLYNAVAHNLMGAILLGTLVWVNWLVRRKIDV
ncbi:COX15/CtaA family protein [Psychrobium sp. nBUS_13]|uniref:COX15/CtaA family protein n=1 Tax=Psychrobium sp. nBUS_13 TaxID=3395319 RepID=UPI003EBA2F34